MIFSDRRSFLKTSVIGTIAGLLTGKVFAKSPTPTETKGPFYPITPQKDKDFDLTVVAGKAGAAKGEIVFIDGRVIDTELRPIENATVDIWQANAAGRYHHPRDTNPAPIDENFQGWAIVQSGVNGFFTFKTIVPGAYPAGGGWWRPPHIHFKVSKVGYIELVTQMYFPDQKLNDQDFLLRRKTPEQRAQMIAKQVAIDPKTYEYTIVLRAL